MRQFLDEIAPEFAGKAKIVKINVDDNQLVAGQFGVRSIPTYYSSKNGQLVATQVGALPKNQLAAFINQTPIIELLNLRSGQK